MACKIERPAPQALFDRYLNLFSTTVLGGAQVIPESNEWYASSINYAVAEEFYAISEQAWKERDPREACCENLVEMAAVDGVYPRPAQFAQGYLRLTGEPGAPLPSPLEFVVGDLTFVTASNATQPSAITADGTVVVRVRALIAGPSGNVTATEGQMTTPVAGVSSDVEVCGATFCQGAASEPCDDFRARYLRRLQYSPRSTNQWIMDKLLDWPCATRAIQRAGSCCQCNDCTGRADGCEDCGCKDCGGDLAFYLMFDNAFDCGIAEEAMLDEVESWMFGSPQGYGLGQVEVGICGRIVPVKPVMINIAVDIVGCPTVAQLQQVTDAITEYMGTVEPSKPLRVLTLRTIVASVIGTDTNIEVRLEPVTPSDIYGGSWGPYTAGVSKVYGGGCDFEPDCDYMLCLADVTITRPDTAGASC